MSSESESADNLEKLPRKDEREFSTSLEIQTGPSFLPGIKLAASFKRSWNRRAELFIRDATANSGLSYDEIDDYIANDGPASDTFLRAIGRASERSDARYNEVLAKLVAAALRDDSRVDTITFIVNKIIQLEPVHIRIISLFEYDSIHQARVNGNPFALNAGGHNATKYLVHPNAPKGAKGEQLPLSLSSYSTVLRIEASVTEACLSEIANHSLCCADNSDQWYPTALGITSSSTINDTYRATDSLDS